VTFAFIEAERACFPVATMCDVLEVSRSGFYAWSQKQRTPCLRTQEDARLAAKISEVFHDEKATYGSPRVCAELKARGTDVGRRRVSRLMKQQGLVARAKRRFVSTTQSDHGKPVAPNVLMRDFRASRPNEKWAGDITYLPTASGFIYLAVLLDLYSRRVVGWSISHRLDANLVLHALDVALTTRAPTQPLIHHTDQGVQYLATEYLDRLEQQGVVRSMSRTANCWDNAPAESFFSSLKAEVPETTSGTQHHSVVRAAVARFLHRYNTKRRHSALGYVSPCAFEEAARMGRAA
jgi:putative transposase